MYASAFRPYDRSPQLNQAIGVIRLFLMHRQPMLQAWVLYAHVARARGQQADPQAIVLQALRQDLQSSALCSLLTSPLGQDALDALALEFPGWGLAFELLPVAAKLLCAERDGRNATGAVFAIAGAGLILYALSQK